jgi:menaquinone-specific isochorismate synthase
LARLPAAEPLAWIRGGDGLAAWGVAAQVTVSGPERFSRAQRWWSEFCAQVTTDDTVAVPGTGPVAFASFSFDSQGSSTLIVPRMLIGRRSGQAWATSIGTAADPRGALPPVAVPLAPDAVRWAQGSRSAEDWSAAVTQAIGRITAGELDKVVLARDVVAHVDGPLDARHLLARLAAAYPTCWTFSVGDLVGATPELLVRRTGDIVTSRVLAGTVRRQGDEAADQGLAQALLGSGKDLEEHEYAVHSVALALAAHCTDLDVPSRPSVLALPNVQHLATDITGRLADAASALSLAASLHPTAAVCGTPTERAFAMIRELEGMDRYRYAGPVGWMDFRGDGEFGIALRCAQLDVEQGTVRAFAGCGIVAGSDPDRELAEAAAKLVPIRDALEPA